VAETHEFENEDTERLRGDIEDTRAEMSQTINEIQERLSPDRIMGQVKESVRDATIGKVEKVMQNVGDKITSATEPAVEAMGRAGNAIKETGSSVAGTVRQNPIPAALIGLGVGMLIVNRFRNNTRGAKYSVREHGYSPRGLPSDLGYSPDEYDQAMGRSYDRMNNTGGGIAQSTTETMSRVGRQARDGAVRVSSQIERVVRENPLAVGAAAIAVGAAVGLALPTTTVEQEYMGEASERLVDKAQQVARGAMDKVQNAVTEAGANQQGGGQGSAGNGR